MEGHEGEEAEVGWFGGFVGWFFSPCSGGVFESIPYFEEVFCEEGLGEGFIVYLDALADEAEVWGGVEADFLEQGVGLGGRGEVLG